MLQMPGPVGSRRAGMTGTGVGATYDRNRDVLWLLDKAHSTWRPTSRRGRVEAAPARRPGACRPLRAADEGRAHRRRRARHRADEITITLTEDDERVQMMQLRGNSRITGAAPAPAVDVGAGHRPRPTREDGRTLQNAKLMENAVVELPGDARQAPGKRIVGQDHRHHDGARRHDGDHPQRHRERAGRPAGRGRLARRSGSARRRSSRRRARQRTADRDVRRRASTTAKRAPARGTRRQSIAPPRRSR